MNTNESESTTPRPAFPGGWIVETLGHAVTMSGMTLREYAAIHLRVPNSGTPWLDDMIQQSRRDVFAGQAMQGELAAMVDPEGDSCGVSIDAPNITFDRLAEHWGRLADAMLKETKGGAA